MVWCDVIIIKSNPSPLVPWSLSAVLRLQLQLSLFVFMWSQQHDSDRSINTGSYHLLYLGAQQHPPLPLLQIQIQCLNNKSDSQVLA